MSKRVTRKYIRNHSDVLVDSIGYGGRFPYPEPTHKVAHAECAEGCAGWMREGDISGAIYGCDGRSSAMWGDDVPGAVVSIGARERAVLEKFDHIVTGRDGEYSVVTFIADDGSMFAVGSDNCHDWRIVG